MLSKLSDYLFGTRQIVSGSSYVGAVNLRLPGGAPCRIFYPTKSRGTLCIGWWLNGLSSFIEGYLHILLPNARASAVRRVLTSWVACIISIFFPWAHSVLPMCYEGGDPESEPLAQGTKYPLILFSHGLTGTGEEHALMFVHWAQRGCVVACVTHCDGSASAVELLNGDTVLYTHPAFKNYDPDFRPKQIVKREQELSDLRQFILHHESFPPSLRNILNPTKIFAAGFSYGAATAALTVVNNPNVFAGVILLDGWFYIDLSAIKSLNTTRGFCFPAKAFEIPLNTPALFVGTEAFSKNAKLESATRLLASNNTHSSTYHVIAGTEHQNFCDVGFWVPSWLLKKFKVVGKADYLTAYTDLLVLVDNFLDTHR